MRRNASAVAEAPKGLSRELIIATAIEILDQRGETGLTFRVLTARLATGNGAIYWYVADKKALLAAAAEQIIVAVLDGIHPEVEPQAAMRQLALGVFRAFERHPWIYAQLARTPGRSATLRLLERVGRLVQSLGVSGPMQFTAASALLNYVLGAAGQNVTNSGVAPSGTDRTTFLSEMAAEWGKLDPVEYAFVRHLSAQLPEHDDEQQFLAGVDFILAGVEAMNRLGSHRKMAQLAQPMSGPE